MNSIITLSRKIFSHSWTTPIDDAITPILELPISGHSHYGFCGGSPPTTEFTFPLANSTTLRINATNIRQYMSYELNGRTWNWYASQTQWGCCGGIRNWNCTTHTDNSNGWFSAIVPSYHTQQSNHWPLPGVWAAQIPTPQQHHCATACTQITLPALRKVHNMHTMSINVGPCWGSRPPYPLIIAWQTSLLGNPHSRLRVT